MTPLLLKLHASVPLRNYVTLPVLIAVTLTRFASPVSAQITTRTLAPGIVYTQEITSGAAPLVINALRIDLSAPGVRVQTGQAQDVVSLNGPTKGREVVHSLAARHNALAAVNADFFPFTGDPLGLSIRDGELISEPSGYRASLGISPTETLINVLIPIGTLTTPDHAALTLSGLNRVPHDGDVILLTPAYTATPSAEKNGFVLTLRDVNLPVKLSQTMQGTVESIAPIGSGEQIAQTVGHSVQIIAIGSAAALLPAHCRQGDMVQFRFDVTPNTPPPARGRYASRAGDIRSLRYAPAWTDVQQAVGGGPLLVRDGQIAIDGEAEGFGRADFIDKRHPRTAAGVDAKHNLLLVTVDGRSPLSRGVSLDEMAQIMKRLGAVQALNFDGGGSTTMTVGSGVVNAPSDGRERPIADGLLVYGAIPETDSSNELQITTASPAAVLTNPSAVSSAPDAPITSSEIAVRVGETCRFQITDADNKPMKNTPVLWGTGDGFGFISQQGAFTCYHLGTGTITAQVGVRVLHTTVRVTSSVPARLDVRLNSLTGSGPERNLLTVGVLDKYGNFLAGQIVTLIADGMSLDKPLVTNKKGIASAIITWSVPLDRRLLMAAIGPVRSAPVRGDSVKPPPPPTKEPIDPDDRP